MRMSGVGTPTCTSVPARSRARKACSMTLGFPTASMQTSAPLPPVSPLIASTGSVVPASTVWVAPNSVASSSFRGSLSTAMMTAAPASLDPATAAHPTPPQPKTATESPGPTWPVYMAAPMPAITPQPSRPTASGRAAGLTLVHWPAATSVRSAKAPMPSAGESGVPSASVIFCVALCVLKQYQGRPRRQARRQVGHAVPDRLDGAGGLVPEEEREVVVDAAFAVVQVGVAHAACLDGDDRLARSGIGHDDRLDGDRAALLLGHDAAHLL